MFAKGGRLVLAPFLVKGVKDGFPPGFDVCPVGEPIIEARKGFAAPPVI
jgi:hypothetical protein